MNGCILRSSAQRLRPEHLRIGGFEPFSTVDYPGAIAAVIFLQGCPLRCFYCHNRQLLDPAATSSHDWAEIEAKLRARRGLLDAVVFSGGEPLSQAALIPAMARASEFGFRIGLHTSGIFPARFAQALALADWVGFDVKTGFADYEAVTGVAQSGARASKSLDLLLRSGVDHEIRTTASPRHHTIAALSALARDLRARGVRRFALQEERSTTVDAVGGGRAAADRLRADLQLIFESFEFRAA